MAAFWRRMPLFKLEQANNTLVVIEINVNVVKPRFRRQSWNRHDVTTDQVQEAGAHARANVPHCQHMARRHTLE